MKATNLIMNSSLSFMGKISPNFLTDGFILIISGRTSKQLKKSLLSPSLKSTGLLKDHKNKKLDFISKSSF